MSALAKPCREVVDWRSGGAEVADPLTAPKSEAFVPLLNRSVFKNPVPVISVAAGVRFGFPRRSVVEVEAGFEVPGSVRP